MLKKILAIFAFALFGIPAFAAPPKAIEQEVLISLATVLDFDYDNIGFDELAKDLARRANLRLRYDKDALRNGELEGVRFTLHARKLTVEFALDRLLKPHGLIFVTSEGRGALVGAIADLEGRLYERSHSVEDLGPFRDNGETLAKLTTQVIRPETWESAGAEGTIEYRGAGRAAKRLIVKQTDPVHREVAQFLARLQTVAADIANGREPSAPRRSPAYAVQRNIPVESASIEATVERLARIFDAPLALDKDALVESGRQPADLVECGGDRLSLAEALEQLDLACLRKQEMFLVTSLEVAEAEATTELYPVGDVARTRAATDELIDLIETTIEPDCWDSNGGIGAMQAIPEHGAANLLIASNVAGVHDEMGVLLAKLRTTAAALRRGTPLPPVAPPELMVERDVKIAKATLGSACDALASLYGIPIQPRRRDVKDGSISLDRSVEFEAGRLSLSQALDRLLGPHELDFHYQDGRVEIVARVTSYQTVLYPVGDLATTHEQVEMLVDKITSNVSPDEWDDSGGPGSAFVYYLGRERRLLLGAIADYRVQRAVAAYLGRGGYVIVEE